MITESLIKVRNVSFSYQSKQIYKNLTLDIPKGKITAILGPSGTGKTTILRLIGAQLTPNEGTIEFDGINVHKLSRGDLYKLRQRMSMLFQSGALFSENAKIRREVTYKKSRFDFYIEDGDDKMFLEVKGVTLENGGIASFPDAPTERGIKHLNELKSALDEGYKCYILFVIAMKGLTLFKPNDERHKEFGDTLRAVAGSGVNVLAVDCKVEKDSIMIDKFIDIDLR